MKTVEKYFQSIRQNKAKLYSFFEAMPKGADIHHHALGAIWAEDVLEKASEMGLWVDLKTGQLYDSLTRPLYKVADLVDDELLRHQVFAQWSVLSFDKCNGNSALHFFDIFPKLFAVFIGQEAYWLEKIANQAAREGLLYIETLIEIPRITNTLCQWGREYNRWPDNPTVADFEQYYAFLQKKGLEQQVAEILDTVAAWQMALDKSPNPTAKLSYQFYAIRTMEPRAVFAQLLAYFEAARHSAAIVGVNLVAPEYHPIALRDYQLHMRICAWLKGLYPEVNLALHAGELTADIVGPEQLLFHIDEAVHLAGASRIGHGVDLLSETNADMILEKMQSHHIALELLPTSNDFILNVKGAEHPAMTYLEAGIPILLATDDPGLLRCRLSDEFFMMADTYETLTYGQLKKMAINSLRYSFLEAEDKRKLLTSLEKAYLDFENQIISG